MEIKNLSDKICHIAGEGYRYFEIKDLRTSIKELIQKTGCDSERTITIENHDLNKIIKQIFGEKLL